jgi:hypothetical protein
MTNYTGLRSDATITGGGKWVAEHGTGFEVCNFSRENETQLGFVRSPSNTIAIERLGASKGDESVDGITVVWTARRPGGGTYVVGWYRNATVYRDEQAVPGRGYRLHRGNHITAFNVEAPSSDVTLLAEDARTLAVPRAKAVKGGMGQSNIWYADDVATRGFVADVTRLIEHGDAKQPGRKRGKFTPDMAHISRVETAACGIVWRHFDELGYTIKSVEKDNLGWDFEASLGAITLLIEVKGLSGAQRRVEVTPNEYKALKATDQAYRLAIVSEALSKAPRLTVVQFDPRAKAWLVQGDPRGSVNINVIEAARITIE